MIEVKKAAGKPLVCERIRLLPSVIIGYFLFRCSLLWRYAFLQGNKLSFLVDQVDTDLSFLSIKLR